MAFTFSQKVGTILKLFLEPKILSAIISQRKTGYLFDVGWFESFKIKKAVDKYKNPIPWFTYPSIDFFSPRLNKNQVLLEFGSGNSTLFFAKKTKKVVSIEHNKDWFNITTKSVPENSNIILTKSESLIDYLFPVKEFTTEINIVVVDGIHRNDCLKNSLEVLSSDGVIILDDSERTEYKEGVDFILSRGFNRIDFWGIAPAVLFKKCTTIFYQNGNCLGI
jgi:hypothetical protein